MLPAKPERGVWSQDEHDRFLKALQLYPDGPWRAVAEYVGSRSVRQVQTHAQKYHEKVARRLRGLRKERKRVQHPEHRIDDEMLEICQTLQRTTQSDPRTALPSDKPLRFADLLDEEQPAMPTAEMFICVEAENDSLKGIDTPSFNECMDFLIEMLGSNEKFVASIAYGSDSESEMSA
ncbi:hypothetical protein Poli38472_011984 [Pythium oligandrum]|uniref:Uncharacterized protein n=1 Tax=Pythium oligandrum TaxID=41045 RepID=A0A8K1FQS2_PYTOL|nr:hypothetical protein Poli38472_011984 [Pythium oligandrum]|eukprot:TMW66868.1 hypothetical protein Poli38472_011984 [Pythium oligandrum]